MIYHVAPPLFLYVLYLEKFQNKSNICHVCVKNFSSGQEGKTLPKRSTDYRRDGTRQHCEKCLEMIVNPKVVEVYTS